MTNEGLKPTPVGFNGGRHRRTTGAVPSTKQPAIVTDLTDPVSSWLGRSDETVVGCGALMAGSGKAG